MAITSAVVAGAPAGTLFDVTATLDADVGPFVLTHNLNLAVPWVVVTPLLDAGVIAKWFVSAFAANSISLTKANVAGSGNAGAQIRVAILPYTLARLVPGASS